jgi:ProP effector
MSDLAATQALIELLAEQFPRAFFVFQRRRRPLKLGIHRDIIAALDGAITPEELSAALRYYVGNACYLRACRAGAERIDLAGEAAGAVTPEESANSAAVLARRKAKDSRISVSGKAKPEPVSSPRRIGLADLKAAALARKQQQTA